MILARRRFSWPAASLVAGLALAMGAAVCYLLLARPPSHDYGTVPPPGSLAVVAAPGHAAGRPAAGPPSAADAPRSSPHVTVVHVPLRLRLPAIGVSAPLVPTGVQRGGGLAIPPDPADVGWWAGGGFPGEPAGAMILAGHVDSAASGPGALLRLQDVRPGEHVTVVTAGRAYRYRVVALRAYAKQALPAAAIFGQQVTARLVIISCGGPFDPATGHYLDNIVAYAVPANGS